MCGIAGIIDFTGRPIDEALLHAFRDTLQHRGPDANALFRHHTPNFSVGLAHTRLAVIDTAGGAQPMFDASKRYVIAYNGELYNFRKLRSELGFDAATESDTEVVLHACRRWGESALKRFRAMWSLAFVDLELHSGHLSRDPMGIKPLFYARKDDQLVFASEMSALLKMADLPRDLDREALAWYLSVGWIPHPLTIYRHVRKLPPGHMLRFDANGVGEPERFFHLEPPSGPPPVYEDACRELRAKIESAVIEQRVADVPLGAFLSGGLDSSIVVACLARAGERVRTFSIGYPEHAAYDETRHARLVAEHFGTEHHDCPVTFRDVIDTVEPMLNHLGEPFADSSLLPTSLVSRHTREHVTVALSGDGGDELFGGYWRYFGHHYLSRYHKLPGMVRHRLIEPLLARLPDAKSSRLLNRVRQMRKLLRGDRPDPMDRHLAWARHLDPTELAALMGADEASRAARQIRQAYRDAPGAWWSTGAPELTGLERILLADLAIGLPGDMLCKVDLASMYHSLEVRVPLLSTDVVNYVTSLPVSYRIQGTTGKRILRDAFRGVLPEPILGRSKMGFEVPIGEFLRNELRDLYHDLVRSSTLEQMGLDAGTAGKLYADHARRRQDHAETLWSLMVLCHWYERQRRSS